MEIWIVTVLLLFPNFTSSTIYKFEENKVPCHPCHVHISYGDTISDITVMWATQESCNSTLAYGTDPWNYQHSVDAEMMHFEKPTMSGLHCVYRAKLKGLHPNTTYFYRPTSGDVSSGPHFFKTPVTSTNLSPEFLICGDHRPESDSIPYIDREILSGQYDAILHVGEFAHDVKPQNQTDSNTTVCFPSSGDVFMQLISNIASHIPYMPTPGKHRDLFGLYRNWFSTPGTNWPIPLDKMWYSIDIGPVHFISYSTEVFFMDNTQYKSEQNEWLMKDLTDTNRDRQAHPWIIVFGHEPMYCSQINGDDCSKSKDSTVRDGLEHLFFMQGVDLVIQSHGVSYERLLPVFEGEALNQDYNNPKAPVQIITGTTGTTSEYDKLNANPAKFSSMRLGEKGLNSFTRMKVHNKTHLLWEQVSAKDKNILDSIWIVQEYHGPFVTPARVTVPPKPVVNVEDSKIPSKATDMSPSSSNNFNDDSSAISVEEFFDQTSNKVLVGLAVGIVSLVLIISIVLMVKKKQRIRSYKRWEGTVDYGRKFYSAYAQVGKDDKDGSDFEVDSTEGNPSSKLLADK